MPRGPRSGGPETPTRARWSEDVCISLSCWLIVRDFRDFVILLLSLNYVDDVYRSCYREAVAATDSGVVDFFPKGKLGSISTIIISEPPLCAVPGQ